MIFLQVIPVAEVYQAINFDVIFFLVGMFALVSGLEVSGLLQFATAKVLQYARTPEKVLAFILVILGVMSAFLINDTIALVATPIVIGMAGQMKLSPVPLLICLAFAVTIGSMMTPVGNPQNLLIALESGIEFPFLDFVKYLALPTFANFLVTYYIVKRYFRKELALAVVPNTRASTELITDRKLAKVSAIITCVVIVGFFTIGIVKLFGITTDINFSHVALLGGAALFAVSAKRREIIHGMNWPIIIFFISMFIVMDALWTSGVVSLIASFLPVLEHSNSPLSLINIIAVSVGLSQVMSNVPFVAVYLKVMQILGFSGMDTKAWMALAGGSTLAGNLTILGAASNVIILEAAEKRKETFSFIQFLKIGAIVTPVNVTILIIFLMILP
jgi:Na+/H+ antiporter NhaD/arsenite permease-like protein